MKHAVCLALALTTQTAFAACPTTLDVTLKGLKALEATPANLAAMVEAGDNQTPEAYFVAVLRAISATRVVRETFTLKEASFSRCDYKTAGKDRLTITDPNTERGAVTFTTIPVRFNGKSMSTNGPQVDVTIKTGRALSGRITNVVAPTKVLLTTSVLVQIPLGDYGTDGFDEDVKVGEAAEFSVIVKR